jgi:hypothetical protein
MNFLDRSRQSSGLTGRSGQGRYQDATSSSAPSSTSALAQRPRHAGLFEATRRLDLDLDATERRQLADWIRAEYQREFNDVPLGFIGVCYLGPPLVDHRLDLLHSIVDHYAPAQVMPDPYQQARMLVRGNAHGAHGAYEFVEVYANGRLIPVRPDGTPVASAAVE